MIKAVRNFGSRLFAERKIIILSQNKVRTIPIGSRLQMFVCAAAVLASAWTSYSTGIYMAYEHLVESKNVLLQKAERKNDELSTQFVLMHRDMQRIMGGKAPNKSDYEVFLADLYASNPQGEESEMLLKRIGYLESKVSELENYRQNFLDKVGTTTGLQIDKIMHVIDMTGLDIDDISSKKLSSNAAKGNEDFRNQGGPFISVNTTPTRYSENLVMNNISGLSQLQELMQVMPLSPPLSEARRTSSFGVRKDPLTRRQAMHSGLDFSAVDNAKVHATSSGTVIGAGRMGAYGNMVEIDHGFGLSTRYAHLKEFTVQVGDIIRKGDVIGIQGNTGRSTGAHVHYEVRFNDRPLDPQKFLDAGDYAEEKRINQSR